MNINEIKDELIDYGKLLFDRGLSVATSGNISARWGSGCIISATGTCLGRLTRDDLVLIDENANVMEGKQKPSSEKFIHLKIYQTKKEVNAVFHTHPPYTTAFSVAGIELEKPVTAEFVYYFNKIPIAKYAPPGSDALVKYTLDALKDNAVLMANHGLIVCAENIPSAFYLTETAENTAQIYINALKLGSVKSLSAKEVNVIYQLKR